MTTKNTLLIILSLFLFSCGADQSAKNKKKIHEAVSAYANPDQVDSIVILDTIMVVTLKEVLATVDSAEFTLDSLSKAIPKMIEETEERLAKAEETLKNLSFPMLKPMWEQNIATDRRTLARQQNLLREVEGDLKNIRTKKRFTEKALENAGEEIGYYMIDGYVEGSGRRYWVSPGFVVLNEKPKEVY